MTREELERWLLSNVESAKAICLEQELRAMMFLLCDTADIQRKAERCGMKVLASTEGDCSASVVITPMELSDQDLFAAMLRFSDGRMGRVFAGVSQALRPGGLFAHMPPDDAARRFLDVLQKEYGLDRGDFRSHVFRQIAKVLNPTAVLQMHEGFAWQAEGSKEEAREKQAAMRKQYGPSYAKWPGAKRIIVAILETAELQRTVAVEIVPTDDKDTSSPAKSFGETKDSGFEKKSDSPSQTGRLFNMLELVPPAWEQERAS
jgi:hypothetical protein